MANRNLDIFEEELKQIADMLLLNGTLTKCPGLVHGKMGIAIFFFQYARYSQNPLFAEYAMDVIGELVKQLHANYRSDYEKGIAGIGTGIHYLIKEELVDADIHIFEDFDERMYRAVQYDPFPNFSMYEGLIGYGNYWLSRLQQQPLSVQAQDCLIRIIKRIEENMYLIPSEEWSDVYCFLFDLQIATDLSLSSELLEQSRKQVMDSHQFFPRLGNSVLEDIIRQYLCQRYFKEISSIEIHKVFELLPPLDRKTLPAFMGLLDGYAGEGLLRLTALNGIDPSWMQLL